QPPPLSVGDADEMPAGVDRRRDQHAFLVDLAADAVDTAAGRKLRHVDGDVDADQRARDPGADPLEARTPHAVRDSLDTLLPAGMLRTADADRRHRRALRADRAAALGARQPGDETGRAACRKSVTET